MRQKLTRKQDFNSRGGHTASIASINNPGTACSVRLGSSRTADSGVTFHRLPANVISLYPEWRGYEYILVGNEILVINPRTSEIVDVIPV